MSRFRTTRGSGHSPIQMLDLVADVERYPEFLPLCEAVDVVSRGTLPAGETLAADMTVGYRAISETFRSNLTVDRERLRIEVACSEPPFAHLENLWEFSPDGPAGCVIAFDIDYRFRSRARQLLMVTMFDKAFAHFVRAFEARANAIYGAPVTQP